MKRRRRKRRKIKHFLLVLVSSASSSPVPCTADCCHLYSFQLPFDSALYPYSRASLPSSVQVLQQVIQSRIHTTVRSPCKVG